MTTHPNRFKESSITLAMTIYKCCLRGKMLTTFKTINGFIKKSNANRNRKSKIIKNFE